MTGNHYHGNSVDRLINRLMGLYATIFTIHRPTPDTGAYGGLDESLLERCLEYAKNRGYRFISLDQLVQEAFSFTDIDQPTICFTLDDGYLDQATRLLPILLKHQAAPTLFIITDFVDGKLWSWDAKLVHLLWNSPLNAAQIFLSSQKLSLDLSSPESRILARRQVINIFKSLAPELHESALADIADACKIALPTEPPETFRPVSWASLRQLEEQGLHVGSHSQTHLVFNAASDEAISHELAFSKDRLTAELKNPSSVFCFPIGTRKDFQPYHGDLVKNAGYNAAITTISNVTRLQAIRENPFQIERIAFPNSFEKFVRYASWKEALRSKFPF